MIHFLLQTQRPHSISAIPKQWHQKPLVSQVPTRIPKPKAISTPPHSCFCLRIEKHPLHECMQGVL